MIHRQLTALSAVAFVLAGNANVLAVPVKSWNLSRDLMSINGYPTTPTYGNINTVGAWTFLYGSIGSVLPLNQFSYTSGSPSYASWKTASIPYLGVYIPTANYVSGTYQATITKGLTFVQPGPNPNQQVIVKWAGNTTGTVRVLARFADIETWCGSANGVTWIVYKNNTVLGTGTIPNVPNGDNGAIFDTAISVLPTDSLYFVVDANGDYQCDTTALDVLITATP